MENVVVAFITPAKAGDQEKMDSSLRWKDGVRVVTE